MKVRFHSRDRRNDTGCVGVSFTVRVRKLRGKSGGTRVRRYYNAYFAGRNRDFRIDLVGQAEAFRRAVAWRAARERAATEGFAQSH